MERDLIQWQRDVGMLSHDWAHIGKWPPPGPITRNMGKSDSMKNGRRLNLRPLRDALHYLLFHPKDARIVCSATAGSCVTSTNVCFVSRLNWRKSSMTTHRSFAVQFSGQFIAQHNRRFGDDGSGDRHRAAAHHLTFRRDGGWNDAPNLLGRVPLRPAPFVSPPLTPA